MRPSGAGKTESVLKPLAFQSLSQRIPLVFVDGKADAQLAKECFYFSQTKEIPFYIFNTLEITEKDHSYDTSKTSHTFNPLLFSNDPAKLTDALVLSLNLQSSSDAKFYLDAQKAFLLQLFNVFLATNKGFTFIDIVEFMKYQDTRAYVFDCATKLGNKHAVDDMKVLLESFDKNLTQLLGLRNILEQLFVSDTVISKLINVYDPVINIHDILTKKQAVLFSLSAGDRFQSNMALAKMIVSILNSLVGSKQGYSEKEDWMIILDEFGQFSTDAIKPLITTARSTNTAIALSYQSKEQLMNVEGLADIVNTNCDTKCIFKSPDQADEWAKLGGTVESIKRTDVIEDDAFATESREGRASLRQVDELIWQDPIDKPKYKLKSKDIKDLKSKISKSKISVSDLVSTAWASASTFRGSDKRGGANGARIMLEPQKNWKVNNPKKLSKILKQLSNIKNKFDTKKKSVSMADLIVLAGNVGIEIAAKKAGHKVNVPFSPGRGDARQDQTDIKKISSRYKWP